MTATGNKLITADELLTMPRGYGKRYELIRGGERWEQDGLTAL